jgi:nucleoid-associated protein YgaU
VRTSTAAARGLRAAGAAAAIAVLIGAPPYALIRYVGTPLPYGWSGLTAGQFDDQAVIGVLSLVVWAAWVQLAACVLIEAVAGLRGARLPRRPTLAFTFQQDLARTLLAPLLSLTLGATTAAIHPGQAIAAPVSSPPLADGPATTTGSPTTSTAAGSPVAAGQPPVTAGTSPTRTGQRTYVVQPPHGRSRDSLWRIAAEHLGNGQRWREIYALNHGRLMPDGRRMTSPGLILPGWPLLLPADATGLKQPAPEAPAPAEVTVRPGDTLGQIAANQYGDAAQYPRIFTANHGRTESDGRTVTDPDLIYPGWRLSIPQPIRAKAQPPSRQPPPRRAPSPTAPRTEPAPPPSPAASSRPTPTARPPSPATEQVREGTTGHAAALRTVFAGVGALLAAGLLAALVRLQRRRSRFRRPGRLVASAPPELAEAEKAIRSSGSPALADVDFLDHALRSLTTLDSAPPDIAAARMAGDHLDLRLAHPHRTAPSPWTSDESGYWWSISRADPLPVHADNAADCEAPYPALVGIGHTDDGERWLLDLEHLAAATLSGPTEACLNLARFIAAELAVNAWSDHITVTLAGFGAEMVQLNPARLHHTDDPEHTIDAMAADIAEVAQADILTERANDRAELRPPQILLIAAGVGGQQMHRLNAAIQERPGRTGVAVVSVNPENHSATDTWQLILDNDGHLTIPALGIQVTAPQLPAEHATDLAALLHAARDTTDHPMPPAAGTDHVTPFSDVAGAVRAEHTKPRPSTPDGEDGASLLPAPDRDYLERAATTSDDLAALAPRIDTQTARAIEDADPDLDTDLAAWHDPDCPLPRLTLLGPVELRARGDHGEVARRIAYYTEIVAYLATRPHGATADQLADTFSIKHGRVRTDVYLARKWLGTNPRTGKPHIPKAPQAQPNRGISVYQIEDILSDADLFRRLRIRGQARGPVGIADLQAALNLVTGQPLSQLRPDGYTWLADDPLDHYYTAAIVDAAHILATHHLAVGEPASARAAAEAALRAAPYEEVPRLDLAAAHHAEGNNEKASRLVRDGICNRAEDSGAPEDLPTRTTNILNQGQWSSMPTADSPDQAGQARKGS